MFPNWLAPGLSPQSDPDRRRAAVAETSRSARLYYLVLGLVEFARVLRFLARERANTPDFAALAKPFGIADARLLIARFSNALGRALALCEKLEQDACLGRWQARALLAHMRGMVGARQQASRALPDEELQAGRQARQEAHQPARREAERAAGARAGREAPPDPGQARRAREARQAARLDPYYLLTGRELTIEINRRPMVEVLRDICHALDITPDHPFWRALCEATAAFGFNLEPPEQAAAQQQARPPSAERPWHHRVLDQALTKAREFYAAWQAVPAAPGTGPP